MGMVRRFLLKKLKFEVSGPKIMVIIFMSNYIFASNCSSFIRFILSLSDRNKKLSGVDSCLSSIEKGTLYGVMNSRPNQNQFKLLVLCKMMTIWDWD